MTNKSGWFALCLAVAATPLRADDGPAFQYAKEIKAPAIENEELVSVRLDNEVFAAARDGLPDLRVAADDGKPLPYLLRKAQATKPRTVRRTIAAQKVSAKPLGGGGLEITFETDPKDPFPTGLKIVSPLTNFEQRVRLFTSVDGMDWQPIGGETAIFDYARYMDVRNDMLPIPATDKRHLRLVIDDVTLEQESELLALTRRLRGGEETERTERVTIDRRPFRIDRVELWREEQHEQATGDEKMTYPVSAYRVEEDTENRRTLIEVDTDRQPLTSLILQTPDRNFSRRAMVEVKHQQGVSQGWRSIGEATLSRVDFKSLQRHQLSISFPETRSAHYRIVIENRDSPPLKVDGIAAEGNAYELVYLAAPRASYRLVYGAADAEPASYDVAAIKELLVASFQPTRAELGPQQPGPGAGRTPQLGWSSFLNNPLLLGGVIALLVVALGFGLFQAVKRIDKLPAE